MSYTESDTSLGISITMNRHSETNPHFVRPSRKAAEPEPRDRPKRVSATTSPRRHRRNDRPEPSGQRWPPAPVPHAPMAPLHTHHPDEQPHLEPPRAHPDDHLIPRRGWLGPAPVPPRQHDDEPHSSAAPTAPLLHPRAREDHATPKAPAPPEDRQRPRWHEPQPQPGRDRRHHGGGGLLMPQPRKTRAVTWFLAVFCAVLWVVVILGGLTVLVVYVIFRPRSPRFDVSAASLNAAYLDMGYLLNADLTLLANFTNPNRKVGIQFNYMFVELYYGRTLVATQYLEPFSAPQGKARLADLHMVTSQVRLSELEVQRIKRQTLNNGIVFEVKGFFRARSNFGGLLRYSYWLHTRCVIMLTRPPDGVLTARRCKSKH